MFNEILRNLLKIFITRTVWNTVLLDYGRYNTCKLQSNSCAPSQFLWSMILTYRPFHKYDYIDWSPAFVFIANSEHLFAEIHAAPAVSRDPMQIWWMDAFYGLRDTRMTYTCWGRKEHIQNYDSKLCIRQWLPIKQSLPINTVLGNLCY